jgi:hypothetical protein
MLVVAGARQRADGPLAGLSGLAAPFGSPLPEGFPQQGVVELVEPRVLAAPAEADGLGEPQGLVAPPEADGLAAEPSPLRRVTEAPGQRACPQTQRFAPG